MATSVPLVCATTYVDAAGATSSTAMMSAEPATSVAVVAADTQAIAVAAATLEMARPATDIGEPGSISQAGSRDGSDRSTPWAYDRVV